MVFRHLDYCYCSIYPIHKCGVLMLNFFQNSRHRYMAFGSKVWCYLLSQPDWPLWLSIGTDASNERYLSTRGKSITGSGTTLFCLCGIRYMSCCTLRQRSYHSFGHIGVQFSALRILLSHEQTNIFGLSKCTFLLPQKIPNTYIFKFFKKSAS